MTIDRSQLITGQILTRRQEQQTADGRMLVAVVGVIAVPEGHVLDSEGMQHAIAGQVCIADEEPGMGTQLTISNRSIDLAEKMRGSCLGSALTMPIWRY